MWLASNMDILQTYGPAGVIIAALGGVISKLYFDNRTLTTKMLEISQARVDDLKDLNSNKDNAAQEMSLMVKLIYDKLERGK